MGLVKISANCPTWSPFPTWSLKKVVSHFYVFRSPIKNWVLDQAYGARTITHEGNTLIGHSIISQFMHYLKNLGAAASSNYILGLCGGLCNISLFVRRPTNERRSKKVTCNRSAFSINSTPDKISIGNPTRSSEDEVAEYQIQNSSVYLSYLKIRWTACQCEVCGKA
jgi:hypothetical protein